MSIIQGAIPVTGFIGPTDSNDTYAVTDAIYGIDGYRSVSGTTVRNAISTERRREGMLVYTQNDQNIWQLLPSPWLGTDADWKLFISSGATASLSGNTGFLSLSGGTVSGDTYFTQKLFVGTGSSVGKFTVNTGNFDYGFSHTNGTVQLTSYVGAIDGWIGTKSNHSLYFFVNDGSASAGVDTANSKFFIQGGTYPGYLSGSFSTGRTFMLPDESGTIALVENSNFLPLSGGTLYGDLFMSSSTKIGTTNGGGELTLDAYGSPGTVLLSNDNSAWSTQSQLYLSQNYIELSNFDSGGTLTLAGGYNYDIGRTIGEISLGSSVDGVRIKRLAGSELIEMYNQNINIQASNGNISLNAANFEIYIKNNSADYSESTTSGKQSIFIGTESSRMESGITNSVIIGGQGITGSSSNTVYTPNLQIQSGKVIRSSNGGGQLELDNGGSPGSIFLSTDNGGFGESGIWMDTGSELDIFSHGYEQAIILSDNSLMLYSLSGNNSSATITMGVHNQGFVDTSSLSSIFIKPTEGGGYVKSGPYGGVNPVLVSTNSANVYGDVKNSVALGINSVTIDASNTTYTQNLRAAENGGVIFSAGTDLYDIFGLSDTASTATKYVIVDNINGSDITGQKYSNQYRFATIYAAQTASTSGDTILIKASPVPYTDAELGADGLTYYFEYGARIDLIGVNSTGNQDAFFFATDMNVNVLGYGQFDVTGDLMYIGANCNINFEFLRGKTDNQSTNGSGCFEIAGATVNLNVKCYDKIENKQENIVVVSNTGANVTIEANEITASGALVKTFGGTGTNQSHIIIRTNKGTSNGENIYSYGFSSNSLVDNDGSNIELFGNYIKTSPTSASTAYGFISNDGKTTLYNGYYDISVPYIASIAGGNSEFYQYGNITAGDSTLLVSNSKKVGIYGSLETSGNTASLSGNGGTIFVSNRIVNYHTGSTADAISKQGGILVLDKATLVVEGSSAKSINASTAQDVLCYNAVANKAIGANITTIINPINIHSSVI
jgi:hypothetical protein